MSWSVQCQGRAKAVRESLDREFNYIHSRMTGCGDRFGVEAQVVHQVRQTIALALNQFPDDMPVKIKASGSAATNTTQPQKSVNTVKLSINPLWDFKENGNG